MTRRALSLLVFATIAAAICVRLGVWQLSRLGERRARNAAVGARLRAAPVPLDALTGDSGAIHYRRVRVAGRPDYAHEVVLAGRSREGSPGVNLLTPVRVAGRDTAVLVNRGWVYSPNAADVELARWRDADSIDVVGYVELPSRRTGAARLAATEAAYRWLDPVELARQVGYPVTPYYVVVLAAAGETPSPDRPARLGPPELDEGPHQSYAVQWFSFAAVALVGAVAFARSEGRRPRDRSAS
jgi:surfeit locus 1 family protein